MFIMNFDSIVKYNDNTSVTQLNHTNSNQGLKPFLKITGLVEAGTGFGLVIFPSLIVNILLGNTLSDPVAVLLGRLAGAALITVSIACYFSKERNQSYLMVKAMLVYNIFSAGLLVYAALVVGISGPALWPAVLIHAGLLGWCILLLKRQ
jgi:hypothetical protein